MAQKSDLLTFNRIVDEISILRREHELLVLAFSLTHQPNDKTLERVELLLDHYLQSAEFHFDNLAEYLDSEAYSFFNGLRKDG